MASRIAMPGILVLQVARVGPLVDAHKAWMVWVAADHGVIFQIAEVPGEGNMLGAGEVLVAEKQHAVLHQQCPDLGHHRGVTGCDSQIDV